MVQFLQSARTLEVVGSDSGDLSRSQSPKRTRQSSQDHSSLENDVSLLHIQFRGKGPYVSKSFWASIGEEATKIEGLSRDQSRQASTADLEDQPWRRPALTSALLAVPPLATTSMRESVEKQASLVWTDLSNRAVCDCLLEA